MSNNTFILQALALAQQAQTHNEVPVGAIVVHNDQIIGRGFNQPIHTHDPTAHAEIMAMRQAAHHLNNYRLTDATLYVTLEPCVMCAGAIVHARIKRVVFGAYDPKTGAAGSVFDTLLSNKHNHKVDVIGGVMAEECGDMLQNFFRERRKAS